jgi:hypothetical protein
MEPFNIKITAQKQPVVLTVLPTEKGYFKLIYYGAILVGLKKTAPETWTLVSTEEIEAGDLPFYIPTSADDRVVLTLDKKFTALAGKAIEAEVAEQNS